MKINFYFNSKLSYLFYIIFYFIVVNTAISKPLITNSCQNHALDILLNTYHSKHYKNIFSKSNKDLYKYCDTPSLIEVTSQNGMLSWKVKSAIYGILANTCNEIGINKDTNVILEKALLYSQRANDNKLEFCWYNNSGRINKNNLKLYSQNLFEKENSKIIQDNNKEELFFLKNKLENILPQSKQALEISNRIQNILEKDKVIEINNYFEEDCIKQSNSKYKIKKMEAILYSIPLPKGKIALLLRTKEKATIKLIKLSKEELSKNIYYLIGLINKNTGNNNLEFKKYSSKLYDNLLGLFSTELNSIKNLIIIPSGNLSMLPWVSLYDKKDKIYVIDKEYAISLIPGLSLFIPKSYKNTLSHPLFLGYAKEGEDDDISNNVLNELKNLRDFSKNINILISGGNKISKENLKKMELSERNLRWIVNTTPHSLVHLSTHAKFQKSNTNEETGILFPNKTISFNSFGKIINSSSLKKGGIDLLYLSACQTAASSISSSKLKKNYDWKSSLGLTGMAIRAGVSTVIGNLIKSDTDASTKLSRQFYKNLKNGDSKSIALKKAQQYLYNMTEFKNPYYWAPIVLVGDWH